MTTTVPHQALYRRWRAQTFAEIVGQEAVVETLRNAVRTDRVSHAVLFVGPRGTGKTSLARILAKAVNCTDLQDGDACDRCPSCVSIREGTTLDLIEIDAASNRGIDAVRDLRERLPYPPGQLRRKVYILDEAHQITRDAWNALLKSLEEPPDFVIFMFASTEPSGFPPAILSRLQRFDVRRLTVPEIEGKLARILAADGREADPGRDPPHRPAGRRRHARRRVDARPAAVGRARAHRRVDRPRPARPGRRRGRRGLRRPPRARRRRGRRRAARHARGARPRPPGPARPGGRGDPGRAGRRRSPIRRPPATTRRRWRPPAGGSPRSTRTAPAIGGLRFQLELAMFAGADAGARRRPHQRAERPVPDARDDRDRPTAASPSPPPSPALDAAAIATPPTSDRPMTAAPGDAGADRAEPGRRATTATAAPAPTRLPRPSRPRSRRRPRPTPAAPPTRRRRRGDGPGRRPRGAARGLAGDRRAPQRPPADQAAHRRVPAGRRRRRDRDPRLPGGAGVPQGAGRAPAARHRGRHRRGPRAPGHGPLRGRQRRARRRPVRTTSSPRPAGSSPTSWPTSARSADRGDTTRRAAAAEVGCGRLTAEAATRGATGWGWPTCSGWRSRCSRRCCGSRPSSRRRSSTARPAAASSARPSPASRSSSASRSIRRRSTRTTSRCSRTSSSRRSTTRCASSRELAEQKMAAVTGGLRLPGM